MEEVDKLINLLDNSDLMKRLDIVKEALEIPDKIIPLNIIAIGYPAKEENAKNKWDIEKIIWKK